MPEHSDRNNPYPSGSKKPVTSASGRKPLGRYLVEAGLISQAQLEIALRDQTYSGYPLGEILVLRGWIEQSVIDLVVQKLQPVSDVMENELKIIIDQGQPVARGVIGNHAIVSDDDNDANVWDQDTTVQQIVNRFEDEST